LLNIEFTALATKEVEELLKKLMRDETEAIHIAKILDSSSIKLFKFDPRS